MSASAILDIQSGQYMTTGEFLKRRYKHSRKTQKEISDELNLPGVDETFLSKIFNSVDNLPLQALKPIVKVLGLSGAEEKYYVEEILRSRLPSSLRPYIGSTWKTKRRSVADTALRSLLWSLTQMAEQDSEIASRIACASEELRECLERLGSLNLDAAADDGITPIDRLLLGGKLYGLIKEELSEEGFFLADKAQLTNRQVALIASKCSGTEDWKLRSEVSGRITCVGRLKSPFRNALRLDFTQKPPFRPLTPFEFIVQLHGFYDEKKERGEIDFQRGEFGDWVMEIYQDSTHCFCEQQWPGSPGIEEALSMWTSGTRLKDVSTGESGSEYLGQPEIDIAIYMGINPSEDEDGQIDVTVFGKDYELPRDIDEIQRFLKEEDFTVRLADYLEIK